MKLENIYVSLMGKPILKNININVDKGSFTCVLGSSGCGKSTLLKTIAGIIQQESGSIYIEDKKVDSVPVQKRGAVIVFQDLRVFPHMTVFENIAFPLKATGQRKKDYEEKVLQLIESVQLKGLEKRNAKALSGGQQQRVALARALSANPKILLLDEPFSSLDENLRFDMRIMIKRLHEEYKMTIIMVTHDKNEALSLSDTILVMDKGEVIQCGTPKEVYEKPTNIEVAKYFGDATFVMGVVTNGSFKCEEFSIKCNLADGQYTLMLRPDAFYITKGKDFKFVYEIYTGKSTEWIFEHIKTGLLIKCKPATYKDEYVSIRIDEDKALFF